MQNVESPADFGTDPGGVAKRWIAEIQARLKAIRSWVERGRKIVRRYKDEREESQRDDRRINMLWSNVETLKPALYARTPKPVVSRRFLDKDVVGRVAAEILERATAASCDLYDFDAVMRLCVQDHLLPGSGQAWVRYEPTFGEPMVNPVSGQPVQGPDGKPLRPVAYEMVTADYVFWGDFLHGPGRTWAEVPWVAKRAYLTRDELKERFGDDIGSRVPLDHRPEGVDKDDKDAEILSKASVWECWHRVERKIYFIHTGFADAPLAVKDYPFDLADGFPCPRPLLATTASDSLIPVPDFAQYQDQAEEMDDLTRRIASLQKGLKLVGVYDSSASGLQRLLGEGYENAMVPVENWANFSEKGGLTGAVSFLPIDMVATTLVQLYEARERVKADLYEVTGISDILRGQSDAEETATAQSIKAQWGSIRVRDRQAEVQRFARDVIRIKAEIMAEVFQPQTLELMSGVAELGPEYQQAFPQALELLRQDMARNFRIDVETDSTIAADEDAEKNRRVEFLTAVGGFMQQALPVAQAQPMMVPVLGEMLKFAVRGFRAGRELEGAIEQAVGAMVKAAQQAAMQPPPPDPAMVKAETEREVAGAKLHIEQQKVAGQLQLQREKVAGDMAIKQQAAEANAIIKASQPAPEVTQ